MEAWWELFWAAFRIRIPLGRRRLLENAMQPISGLADPLREEAILNAIDRARRLHSTSMHCLEQALACVWMLRRRGLTGTLKIGCRRQGSQLQFHAWVMSFGTPESDQNQDRFAPFVSCGTGFPA